jgi:hypothetical protein
VAEHDGEVGDAERPGGATYSKLRARRNSARTTPTREVHEKKAMSRVSSQKFIVKIAERMMMM